MPTGRSWTEQNPLDEALRALEDTATLVRFRAGTVRPGRAVVAGTALLATTAAVALLPAGMAGAGSGLGVAELGLRLLPAALVATWLLAVVGAVASGGGRELLPRDQAAPYPLGPGADHLGALLLAPLNIAWLMQAWSLLAITAYVVGPVGLLPAQLVVLLWLLVATAAAQAVAWTAEWVRRGPAGALLIRGAGALLLLAGVGAHLAGWTRGVPEPSVTRPVVAGMLAMAPAVGPVEPGRWLLTAVVLAVLGVVAVAVGVVPARANARRIPREEARVEGGIRRPRALPGSDLAMLLRLDRASVWRAAPIRRGIGVLVLGPGLVALAGDLEWYELVIVPALVASGVALLFGVNGWSLDGRGMLWRESLPLDPGTALAVRGWVLAEVVVVGWTVALVIGSLRAGLPSALEVSAVLSLAVVVTGQVLSACLRWSIERPYAVDLRSARATPAPPVAMIGYSVRLAVVTTLTALLFTVAARVTWWEVPPLMAVPFLLWSGLRLTRAVVAWQRPAVRARVTVTVAA